MRTAPLATHLPSLLAHAGAGGTADGLMPLLNLRGGMTLSQGWTFLFAATCSEIMSTYFMNAAKGFSKPLEAVLACLFYAGSFVGFNLSLRALEISIAYAVWSAVVVATLSFMGMAFLGESVSKLKIAGISCIMMGTVCLNLATAA
jgi:small multidrug resistance pump